MSRRIPVALAALCLAALSTPSFAGDRIRYECDADGAGDISMSARYGLANRNPGARRKFSAEFEAAPGGDFREGQKLQIEVAGVVVGRVTLDQLAGGDVVGDLNFDTRADGPDEQPFPGNFPGGVGRGTQVKVLKGGSKILACKLR